MAKEKNNIRQFEHCYGCGVCVAACPHHIIEMRLNGAGFWSPHIIDAEACTGCGLCVRSCSYSDTGLALEQKPVAAYAGWSIDAAVRAACSSGGVAYEISRSLIGNGYKVCAVTYNAERHRAEHYIADDLQSLTRSVGSKYIPSYSGETFAHLDLNQRYLVVGTPCQVDSLRRLVRLRRKEDNFVFVDFFCHGVPSMRVWNRYVKEAEKKLGEVRFVSWRNKSDGWGNSWSMSLDGEAFGGEVSALEEKRKSSAIVSMRSEGDPFYYMFLSNSCLNKACYSRCKFKYDRSSADIRIGDLWGQTYADESKGVSAVVAFAEKGVKVLNDCKCELTEHKFELVAEGQMKAPPRVPATYSMLKFLVRLPFLSLSLMRKLMIYEEVAEYLLKRLFKIKK